MKNLTTKMNLKQIDNLMKSLENLMEVKDLEFAGKLFSALVSLEQARSNYLYSPKVQEYKEKMSGYAKELEEFDNKKFAILEEFASRDSFGNIITQRSGDQELYVFDDKTFLNDMTIEEIKAKFGEANLVDYAMKDTRTGEPMLDVNGNYKFSDSTSVESIERFSRITELELEYKPMHDDLLRLHKLSEQEVFDVEVSLLEESDKSQFFSLKDLLTFRPITAEAIEDYERQIEEMIQKEMENATIDPEIVKEGE